MTNDLTGDLDLLGDWLDAKGYGEEAGLCTRVMDHMHKQDARISELRKEADMMHSEYKTARARIAALEAALKEQHRHHLKVELRCRELEAEKQAFKDGNKYD